MVKKVEWSRISTAVVCLALCLLTLHLKTIPRAAIDIIPLSHTSDYGIVSMHDTETNNIRRRLEYVKPRGLLYNAATVLSPYGSVAVMTPFTPTSILSDYSISIRNLRHHDHWANRLDSAFLGKRGIVGNISVHGAIVNSDVDALTLNPASLTPEEFEAKRMSFIRLENIRNLSAELPFELVHWPAVMTRPCPQNRHGHKTERGVALAHFQIWSDFVFFDHDVLDNLKKGIDGGGAYNSSSYSSTSGFFSATSSGALFKNGVPYLENDVLVVFEDDAESVVKDTSGTLIEELSSMTTDLLYLGWCEGRLARPVPLCTQAYALTRSGARKMVQLYEPCGMALDEQMVKFCKNNWITYRTINDYSHKKNFKPNYPRYGDKTFGMFHQKKHEIPSINGH
jgi:hypothetical protein